MEDACAPCRGTVRHDLKTWPKPFNAILSGSKKHEIRVDDRCFREGDELMLREFDPQTQQYTGRFMLTTISYLSKGPEWGLPEKLCVMSIRVQHWNIGV